MEASFHYKFAQNFVTVALQLIVNILMYSALSNYAYIWRLCCLQLIIKLAASALSTISAMLYIVCTFALLLQNISRATQGCKLNHHYSLPYLVARSNSLSWWYIKTFVFFLLLHLTGHALQKCVVFLLQGERCELWITHGGFAWLTIPCIWFNLLLELNVKLEATLKLSISLIQDTCMSLKTT